MGSPREAGVRVEALFAGGISVLPEEGHLTGIYKQPVAGPLFLGPEGLQGDRQADLRNHGGPERALNHYPAEHYALWARELAAQAGCFVPGAVGENLSTRGMVEDTVHIGDVFRLGGAVIQVSQPRSPCFKLNHRFEIPDFSARAAAAGRVGWLYRVLAPGEVRAGEELVLLERPAPSVSVAEVWRTFLAKSARAEVFEALAALETLAPVYRERFRMRAQWARSRARAAGAAKTDP